MQVGRSVPQFPFVQSIVTVSPEYPELQGIEQFSPSLADAQTLEKPVPLNVYSGQVASSQSNKKKNRANSKIICIFWGHFLELF